MAENQTDRMQELDDVMAELGSMRIEPVVKSMIVVQSPDMPQPAPAVEKKPPTSIPWPAIALIGGFAVVLAGLWYVRTKNTHGNGHSAFPAEQRITRLRWAVEQARFGDAESALREVEALTDADDCTPAELMTAAVAFTTASQRRNSDRTLAEHRAARAVLFLRRAMMQGMPNMDEVWSNSELTALHQRNDFRALAAEWLRR